MIFHQKQRYKLFWLPVAGMGLFILFYTVAALIYSGGSAAFPNQAHFQFQTNYLCDLLDTQTATGLKNPASLYARIALVFLSGGLLLLWWYLPKLFFRNSKALVFMRWSGMLAMGITLFLSSENHDVIVRIAGVFGTIALVLALMALYLDHFKSLFILGILCLVLFLGNYYIYESEKLLEHLPIIQKITFTACIVWFVSLDLVLVKKYRNRL